MKKLSFIYMALALVLLSGCAGGMKPIDRSKTIGQEKQSIAERSSKTKAQQTISAVGVPATLGAYRTANNAELAKVEANMGELYTLKADKSCFATESAFNACFDLTWAAGGSMSWPASAGIMVYGGSSAYGTSLVADGDAIGEVVVVQDDGSGNPELPFTIDLSVLTDTTAILTGKLSVSAIDDAPVDSETAAPISSNWAYDHVAAADPHNGYMLESAYAAYTVTKTNFTLDTAGTGNAITVPLNGALDGAIITPADTDDIIYVRAGNAMTITDIYCQAEGGGSITITLQECDNATCSSPSTIENAITCDADGAEDDGTLTDGSIAAGAPIKVLFSAPTGTVNGVRWNPVGTQTW